MATALFATALLVGLVVTGTTSSFDNAIYDSSLRLAPARARPDIVIVAVDRKSLFRVGQWPWPRQTDADLIAAIARDAPKALACHLLFLFSGGEASDRALHNAMALTRTYLTVPHDSGSSTTGSPIKPAPIIASAATGVGDTVAEADGDGIVRRTFLYDGRINGPQPRLVLQIAHAEGVSAPAASLSSPRGEMLIPFAGPPGAFNTISAISVLDGQVPKGFFKNKFVMLGATAPEMLDNYPTPMLGATGMSSVEVDANILNSLLNRTAIEKGSRLTVLFLSLLMLWVLLFALVRLGPQDNLWLAVAMSALPLAGSVVGIVWLRVWLTPAPYLVTLMIVIPYWGWRRLNAASTYFAQQLRLLEQEAGAATPTRGTPIRAGGDVVLQQMTLLEDTKRRISDLRRFLSDILANFPDPVFVVNPQGGIVTVNQAAIDFARDLGLPTALDAPIEPILSKAAALSGGGRPAWPPRDTGSAGFDAERPPSAMGVDGRNYEVRFTPTRNASDQLSGWIVHLADVTTLVSAMRQREEALQLLSHDMRSPLSAILATLNHPDLEDASPTLKTRIARQAERTLDLADAFVRLAKAETAEYSMEAIDLGHVMLDATEAIWPLAQAKGVRVDFDLDDSEYVIEADRGLLARALVNLLDNAVKVSSAGQAVTCRLSMGSLKGRAAVCCEIADVGGGMARSQLAKLFHKFASGRNGAGRSAGIGLGLALVHAVVTRHGGTIECESIEGQGTVFMILLPLREEAEVREPTFAEA